MKNEIMTFKNEMFGEVRTMCDEKGEPWFVGKDVAVALGYAKPRNAITAHIDEEDKTTASIQGTGSNYKTQAVIINESGLYSLIMASKLPQAKAFKHWVTSEVLPQIRKTGGYIPVEKEDDEKTILCKTVKILMKTVAQKEELIADKDDLIAMQGRVIDGQHAVLVEQVPKVMFADAVMSSDDVIYIGDLAKLISSNGIEVGRARLFSWLRRHGYMFKDSRMPIQKWVNKGLFEVEETVVDNGRRVWLNIVTKVTAKGQEYFVNGFVSGKFTLKDIEIE